MYYTLPKIRLYVPVAIGLCIATGVFPFAVHLDFGHEPLTWQQRAGQSGVLVTYLAAMFGAYSLYWDQKIAHNRDVAERTLVVQQRWLAILERTRERNSTHDIAIAQCRAELMEANAQLGLIGSYPQILRRAGWISIALIAAGSLLQIIEIGS